MADGVLFYNPIVVQLTASGDELYFYLTDTSTDATVYQDGALTTAHAQPVVADSDGEFPAIYMKPSTGDLKAKLTATGNGTEKYTVDPVPISDLASLTASVATNTADITTLEGQVATAESEIDTLQTESTDYESRISTNETDIAALQSGSLTAFTATLAVPGTIAFPTTSGGNDFIMKFQTISIGADTTATMTWDTAFPNNCLFAVACFASEIDDQNDASANVYALTSTQATVQNTAGVTETISVLAIGY